MKNTHYNSEIIKFNLMEELTLDEAREITAGDFFEDLGYAVGFAAGFIGQVSITSIINSRRPFII